MKLNHINLPVSDVAASRDFFAQHFGMTVLLDLPKVGLAMLQDDGNMVLNLSHFDRDATEIPYPPDFHVGFFLDDRAAVDATHGRLTAAGFAIDPPEKSPGRYGFYLRPPGGSFMLEVAVLEMGPRTPARPVD